MKTSLLTQASPEPRLGEITRYVRFPIQRVHLELTNACNFDCVFCPKSLMKRECGFMKTELARALINDLAANRITEKVTFHVMGEPMLHPDFFSILRYVRESGLRAGVTTNGSFLNRDSARTLKELGVDQINISLQTPDEESFETRKARGMTYEDYRQGILDAMDTLRSDGGRTVIKIHFLVTRFNKSVKKFVGPMDIIEDTPSLRAVFADWTRRIYDLPGVPNEGSWERVRKALSGITINRWNVLEVAPGIHLETYLLDSWGNSFGGDNGKVHQSRFGYCPALTDHFSILWNGDFIFCCKDFDGGTRVGNVEETGLLELLNSDTVLSVVRGFRNFRVVHPRCRVCLGGKTLGSSLAKQAGSIFFFRLMKWFFYNQKRLY